MSSVYGLKNELLSLEKRLEEAQKNNDTEKIFMINILKSVVFCQKSDIL